VQDELLVANNTESEYTKGCQDPFYSQDPYNGAIKILAAVYNSEIERNDSIDGRPKEDCDVISASQGPVNDMSHSLHIAPALAATGP
jgi:hypothetical protein